MIGEEMNDIDGVRRVVMGGATPEDGVFTHVETLEPVADSGGRVWFVAGWDDARRVPHLEEVGPYVPRSWFPPASGVRVLAVESIPSGSASDEKASNDPNELLSQLSEAEPAGLRWDETREGMHSSTTIDLGVVVKGEIEIEAGDGTCEILRPGDVYIQYGAMHRWKPLAGSPSALVLFVCLGAEPVDEDRASQ
jgi:hypothetical protein